MNSTLRNTVVGGLVVVVSFGGALWAMNRIWPPSAADGRPALAAVKPLEPVTRTSYVIAPAAITLASIRGVLDNAAPRNLTGKRDNPLSEILGKADIGWSVARAPITVAGRDQALNIGTVITGTLSVTGQLGQQAGAITGVIGGLLNENLGRGVGGLTGKALDQKAEVRGNILVIAKPTILPNWRIEPNLSAQVAVADGGMRIAGIRLNVAGEVKPFLDKAVQEQIASLQQRIRNDPFLEQAARREWAKMCRAIPLGTAGAGLPNLWLELRPTRALAAQPKVDPNALTLTLGMQAETRIVASETKPTCPFPATVELVPAMEQGKLAIGVPIDVPFTEVNRLVEAQFKGRKFPEDGSGPAEAFVQSVKLAASGDRLLISLQISAREKKSWFGFGTQANVHIWGKPALDRDAQILRLSDIEVDLESDAGYGLIGAAARYAIPYLKDALAQNAVVDLKPFAAKARASIAAALADFRKSEDGLQVDAEVTALRLAGIEFDSNTLRVVAEADGIVNITVSKLPGL
jgi:hypothetical protein